MKRAKNIPRVTVAISAIDEEKNIANWLVSVLTQKEEGFVIEKIFIYSDGSTDRTVEIINTFKDKRIKVRNFRKRMGKSYRLN